MKKQTKVQKGNVNTFSHRAKADIRRNYPLYLMLLPVMVYYIIFYYKPMYGVLIAFKDYQPTLGVSGSPWVGLKHFINFFSKSIAAINSSTAGIRWRLPFSSISKRGLNSLS